MNKVGILRDFCKKVGITLEANDYHFPLEFNFTKNDSLKQEQFTFIPDNIVEFFPVIKEYRMPSEVLKPAMHVADTLFYQGEYKAAAEKYKQVIILCHEVLGTVNKICAICHKNLSSISFYERDFDSAIVYLSKAIIIYEKMGEFDSQVVANCYSELVAYYTNTGDLSNAFKSMTKSWEICSSIYPKNVFFYFSILN